jgi:hypothetical protein
MDNTTLLVSGIMQPTSASITIPAILGALGLLVLVLLVAIIVIGVLIVRRRAKLIRPVVSSTNPAFNIE